MHPFVIAFMTLWLLGAVTIGGVVMAVLLYEILTGRRISQGTMSPELAIFIPPGLLVFGIGLMAFGWRMGRGQRQGIERFVKTTLEAERSGR